MYQISLKSEGVENILAFSWLVSYGIIQFAFALKLEFQLHYSRRKCFLVWENCKKKPLEETVPTLCYIFLIFTNVPCLLIVLNILFASLENNNHKINIINLVTLISNALDFFFSTFVCPTEIIAFSDRIGEFHDINTRVVACSVDSQFTHLAW